MNEPQDITVNDEARLVPYWAMALATLAFLVVEYYFWFRLPEHQHHVPPMALRIYLNTSCGLLASLYFLLIGFISQDAPRRAMSARFWMILCFVSPGCIGAVLYFLLRQPLTGRCPSCSTLVQGNYHFCPQCAYQLTASCGKCYAAVRMADQYCTRCGHTLAEDQMPARLRMLG